jgi:pre-mRNA-splicing helicase BRR2
MAFIQKSAARVMRALFEIVLWRNWSSLANLCLDMSNMVAYRIWRSWCPLQQFKNFPDLERKIDTRYIDLTPSDLGELVSITKDGLCVA